MLYPFNYENILLNFEVQKWTIFDQGVLIITHCISICQEVEERKGQIQFESLTFVLIIDSCVVMC